MISRMIAISASTIALALIGPAAPAADYTFTTIDYGTNTDTELYGINDLGIVTGITYDSNGTSHGVIVKNGVVSIVDNPNAGPLGTYFYQLNAPGFVAGTYLDAEGLGHGFLYNIAAKTFVNLPAVPGFTSNFPGAVNGLFEVTGNATNDPVDDTNLLAYYYSAKSSYQLFVDPLSDQAILGTVTFGLNDAGVLVGYYIDANSVAHGYSTPGPQGPVTDIDYPDADNTEAYGINNLGTITGRYRVGETRHGFLLSASGKYTTVDVPGAAQTWITAINDLGDLVGYYEDAEGDYHGFIAKKK